MDNSQMLNIAILYDNASLHVNTIKEHLESFKKYSKHTFYYIPATSKSTDVNDKLSIFDVIIIHYSVRLSIVDHISPIIAEQLKVFGGCKILFIQDEYDTTETACQWIESLGIQIVYTCVPLDQINKVYPKERFPFVEFIPTLTGYVPIDLEKKKYFVPLDQRSNSIGYRGRALPYWYGNLGQEKLQIGRRMREICDKHGIKTDIEWEHDKRIYGDAWYQFLENSRATLGTESGSNIFDTYGQIRLAIENALKDNPMLTYNEAYIRFLYLHEGKVVMNQISPKIFEAIVLRTALILYEGTYSDVVKPNIHYIPLKKDFSNISEVLAKLNDLDYLQMLTNRAYQDIILSEKFSYKKFVENFDITISSRVRKGQGITFITSVVGYISDTNNIITILNGANQPYLSHLLQQNPPKRAYPIHDEVQPPVISNEPQIPAIPCEIQIDVISNKIILYEAIKRVLPNFLLQPLLKFRRLIRRQLIL